MSENPSSNPFQNIDWNKAIKKFILIISVGIIGNLLFVFLTTEDMQFDKLFRIEPLWLFFSFVLAVYPWWAHAWEIQIWSDFFKNKIPFMEALQISVATDLGAAITPTMIGGAPIKMGLLMKKGIKSGQAAAMVSFSGIEDALFIILVIPFSIVFSKNMTTSEITKLFEGVNMLSVLGTISIVLLLFVVLIFVFKQLSFYQKIRLKIKASVSDFLNSYRMISKDGKTHFLLAFLAIGSRWIARFLIVLCLVKGMGLDAEYFELFLSQWKIYAGMTVTPTPGAMGGAEGLFYLVFKNLIAPEYISILITVWRFFTYYLILLLAVLSFNFFMKKTSLFNPEKQQ